MSQKIIDTLRDSVPKKTWNNWFSTLKVKTVSHDKVEMTVANLFIKDWLQSKFSGEIATAIRAATGRELPFEIYDNAGPEKKDLETQSNDSLVRKRPLQLSALNEDCTFETFQVGEENRFLVEAAKEICASPGSYNPFFIFGGVGLGKTHVMQATARRTMERHPEMRVMYVTSEQFMNEMIVSIKSDSVHKFREEYRRKVDMLLIDDIQFLIGKKGVQNEFFHTFNHLHNTGKQLVICSDRSPEELDGFHERYVSRFQMGLTIKIAEPSLETRFRISKGLALRENTDLADEIAWFLADNVDANVRRLRGAIIKMIIQSRVYSLKIDLSLATEVLRSMNIGAFAGQAESPVDQVFACVQKLTGLSRKDIISPHRGAEKVLARQLITYGMKEHLGRAVSEISSVVQRKHSTVIHALRKTEQAIKNGNSQLSDLTEKLSQLLTSRSKAS